METVKFVYDDKEIQFELLKDEVMVNATEMGAVFGKNPFDFYRNDYVKSFIKAFCRYANLRNEDEFSPIGKLVKVVQGGTDQGTWMHRVVALKFAAWLSPEFDVWVFTTIDKLINAEFREQRDALMEKLTAKQKKEMKRQSIIDKYSDFPDIAEYFELEESEKQAALKRRKAFRAQMQQLKFDFNDGKK